MMSTKFLLNLTVSVGEEHPKENLREYDKKIQSKLQNKTGYDEDHSGNGENHEYTINVNENTRNRLPKMFNLRVINLGMHILPHTEQNVLSMEPK